MIKSEGEWTERVREMFRTWYFRFKISTVEKSIFTAYKKQIAFQALEVLSLLTESKESRTLTANIFYVAIAWRGNETTNFITQQKSRFNFKSNAIWMRIL